MGTWTAAVYTPEQQERLGVDESGQLRRIPKAGTTESIDTPGTPEPASFQKLKALQDMGVSKHSREYKKAEKAAWHDLFKSNLIWSEIKRGNWGLIFFITVFGGGYLHLFWLVSEGNLWIMTGIIGMFLKILFGF